MLTKLKLKGYINDVAHHSYHRWPLGTDKPTVDAEIKRYKARFDRVSAVVEYNYLDI